MTIIWTLLRYLYTAWAALVFAFLLLITTPFFVLFSVLMGKRSIGILLFMCRFIAWGLSVMLVIPFRFHNNPNIDRKKAYVVIANHRSNFDAPVAAASTWGIVRFLAKKELLKIPVMGYIFKRTSVNVDRSSSESRKRSMETMAKHLQDGESIFLFPEGTRNKTQDQVMIPFKDGAFRLAIELQAPILPQIYTRTQYVMPNKPLLMRPGMVHVHYLDPIETTGLTIDDIPEFREKVRSQMIEAYVRLSRPKNEQS